MNKQAEQVVYQIKEHREEKNIDAVIADSYMSRSTIYRVLKKDGFSARKIKEVCQDSQVFMLINQKNIILNREFKEKLSKCLSCDLDNVYKKFKYRYEIGIKEYLESIKDQKKNRISDLQFRLLKRKILFELLEKPHTLKELCEVTKMSRSYVIAALKELENVLGGCGRGGMGKGYYITTDKNEIAIHESWCDNWKKSMGYC